MKRFHTSLSQILRLRVQAEKIIRLKVAQARTELDLAAARVAAAHHAIDDERAGVEAQLLRSGASVTMIQQLQWELEQRSADVARLSELQKVAQLQFDQTLSEFQTAQRDRELVERAIEQKRTEHRREMAQAEMVNIQEWSMRPKLTTLVIEREDLQNA